MIQSTKNRAMMRKRRDRLSTAPVLPEPMQPTYPMRINRHLALLGECTRREADTLIDKGLVFVNGEQAELGMKVLETDRVEVRRTGPKRQLRYICYNKPRNLATEDIETHVKGSPAMRGLSPIGRLDKDSEGLIILTNDGRVTDRLLNPIHEHEKEYLVRTKDKLRDSFKGNMERGVVLEDITTKPCKVTIVDPYTALIVLTEGKKHQIRRMIVALHNEVSSLKRVRVMNISLLNMPPGAHRKIGGDELVVFLRQLGL